MIFSPKPPPPARESSCDGKVAFASANLAHAVNRRRCKEGKRAEVYRCAHCSQWHIGSRKFWQPNAKTIQRHEYAR